MDPNITYQAIITLMSSNHNLSINARIQLSELAENLQDWINSGGFHPDCFDPSLLEQAKHIGC